MDFRDRLKDNINGISELPMKMSVGYLKENENLAIRQIPGGKVIRQYYDGIKDQSLNFEIGIKSKNQEQSFKIMDLLQEYLEELDELKSNDSSFEFQGITIANKPFLSGRDEKGFYIVLFDIRADLTTYKKEK